MSSIVYYPDKRMHLEVLKQYKNPGETPIFRAYSDKTVASVYLSRLGGEFLCTLVFDEKGLPVLVERCEKGFDMRYKWYGQKNVDFSPPDIIVFFKDKGMPRGGSIYQLPGEGFHPTRLKNGTEFANATSEEIVPIGNQVIRDVGNHLRTLEDDGTLRIVRHGEICHLVPEDNSDLERLAKEKIKFNANETNWINNLLSALFPEIKEKLKI